MNREYTDISCLRFSTIQLVLAHTHLDHTYLKSYVDQLGFIPTHLMKHSIRVTGYHRTIYPQKYNNKKKTPKTVVLAFLHVSQLFNYTPTQGMLCMISGWDHTMHGNYIPTTTSENICALSSAVVYVKIY